MSRKAQDFDDLFPDSKPVHVHRSEVTKLEAAKKKLIADANFWAAVRDKAKREAINLTGKTEAQLLEENPR